jgi:hypothetical protein
LACCDLRCKTSSGFSTVPKDEAKSSRPPPPPRVVTGMFLDSIVSAKRLFVDPIIKSVRRRLVVQYFRKQKEEEKDLVAVNEQDSFSF